MKHYTICLYITIFFTILQSCQLKPDATNYLPTLSQIKNCDYVGSFEYNGYTYEKVKKREISLSSKFSSNITIKKIEGILNLISCVAYDDTDSALLQVTIISAEYKDGILIIKTLGEQRQHGSFEKYYEYCFKWNKNFWEFFELYTSSYSKMS